LLQRQSIFAVVLSMWPVTPLSVHPTEQVPVSTAVAGSRITSGLLGTVVDR